jgi:hypothetical protein
MYASILSDMRIGRKNCLWILGRTNWKDADEGPSYLAVTNLIVEHKPLFIIIFFPPELQTKKKDGSRTYTLTATELQTYGFACSYSQL